MFIKSFWVAMLIFCSIYRCRDFEIRRNIVDALQGNLSFTASLYRGYSLKFCFLNELWEENLRLCWFYFTRTEHCDFSFTQEDFVKFEFRFLGKTVSSAEWQVYPRWIQKVKRVRNQENSFSFVSKGKCDYSISLFVRTKKSDPPKFPDSSLWLPKSIFSRFETLNNNPVTRETGLREKKDEMNRCMLFDFL